MWNPGGHTTHKTDRTRSQVKAHCRFSESLKRLHHVKSHVLQMPVELVTQQRRSKNRTRCA
jgi:hypothetical protein